MKFNAETFTEAGCRFGGLKSPRLPVGGLLRLSSLWLSTARNVQRHRSGGLYLGKSSPRRAFTHSNASRGLSEAGGSVSGSKMALNR